MPDGANRDPIQIAGWPDDALTISYLGHSTLVMNFFGVRVISDPVLFERVGVSLGSFTVGPRRLRQLPVARTQIEPIDVILITHAHMDHLDLRSLRALSGAAIAIVCDKAAPLIRKAGIRNIRELRWGEEAEVRGLKVRAVGAHHWGQRWPLGTEYGCNSYLIEREGRRLLLGCDSAYTDLFGSVRATPPDVAALSSGAYDPWIRHHANPEQVWEMFRQSGASFLVPIHWGTFKLSREPMDEPVSRLLKAADSEANRIVLREIGGVWTLPPTAYVRVPRSSRDIGASTH